MSRVLAGWRVPQSRQGDVLLVVSELTTNAVVHARSDFVVVVRQSDDGLGVAVADDVPEPPVPQTPTPERVGGRGMRMVASLARWGVLRVPGDGKVVWAKLAS